MIVDTSALVAIFFGEPEQRLFSKLILEADRPAISAATFVELSMVMARTLDIDGTRTYESFIERAGIQVEPVSVEHALLARQAFLSYGRGRHPAALNFGDCFAYALAKYRGDSLLFKGNDFSQTDVTPADLTS